MVWQNITTKKLATDIAFIELSHCHLRPIILGLKFFW